VNDAVYCCFCQFGMKLGSVISGLVQAAIQQLCHLMATVTDIDRVKRELIHVCSIVRQLCIGNAEICQVL